MRAPHTRLDRNIWLTGALVVALAVGAAGLGCASGGSSGDASGGEKAAAEPAKAAPAKGVAPPADHRMAKIQMNMSPQQVQEIMGMPSGQANYPTAKAFMPYNYGNDSGSRVEYKYAGEGRVVFAVPRWGGNMKVVRVDYDPTEDGN